MGFMVNGLKGRGHARVYSEGFDQGCYGSGGTWRCSCCSGTSAKTQSSRLLGKSHLGRGAQIALFGLGIHHSGLPDLFQYESTVQCPTSPKETEV